MAKQTSNKPPGRWIRGQGGYRAFIPDPLPPAITWTPSLVRALSDAVHVVGRLAGEGKRIPKPHLLIRPFVKREAVLSSKIEGTQATLGELLAVDAGAVVERSPDDLRDVGNYVAAMEHGLKRLKKLPISLRLVRELHAKLLSGSRGAHATPGEFRRSQNWIGPPGCTLATAAYVPPPPDHLTACLGDWESFLHESTLPPLVQAAMAHYQFEAIHPFLDGNGRVGRLLITLFLVDREILPAPLLYLSAFFEATRRDYYENLLRVSTKGEWNVWLEYFLNGVARQSEDAISRAERINAMLQRWHVKTARVRTRTPELLLDLLTANPFLTVKVASRQLGLAFTTVQRGVEALLRLSILTQTGTGKRDRVYCAKPLLEILEEPARVRPAEPG